MNGFTARNEHIFLILSCLVALDSLYRGLFKSKWQYTALFIAMSISILWMQQSMSSGIFKVSAILVIAFFVYFYLKLLFPSRESFENSEEAKEDSAEETEMTTESSESVETSEDAPETTQTNMVEESAVKLNVPETIATAFSQFSPEQMRNMTRDTKELLQTQKDLTDTLKMLTPIVSQGAKLMDTFKDTGTNIEKMGNIANIFNKK